MNLHRSTVVLRMRSAAEVLDVSLLFCMRHKRLLAVLWLGTMLPALLLCVTLRYVLDASWFKVWGAAVGCGLGLQGVFTLGASRLLFEQQVRAREVLAQFWRRAAAHLGGLTLHLALTLLATGLIIPAPAALMRLAFTREIVLLERAGPFAAISRGSRLSRHHGWPIVGIWTTLLIGTVAAVLLAELIGDSVVHEVLQFGRPLGSLWTDGSSLWSLAGYFLILPYVAIARFLKYIDIRTRKEGWDVQLKLMAFDSHKPRANAA